MLLNNFNNSLKVRNKQNEYQLVDQNDQNKSPRKYLNKMNSPLKKVNNDQIYKQLKIKLADKQFQLKKLQQDHSIQVTSLIKQLQKQKQQKKQVIKQWKQRLDQQVQYCNKKLQLAKQEYQQKLKNKDTNINENIIIELKKQKNKLENSFHLQINKLKQLLLQSKTQSQSQIQSIKSQNITNTLSIQNSHSILLQTIQKEFQKQILSMKQTHSKQILFYHQLQQSKSKENKAIEKIFTDKIKFLENQLTQKIVEIKSIKKILQEKNSQINEIKREKQNLRLDNICWERKHNRLEKDLQEKFSQKVNEIQNKYQNIYQQKNKSFIQNMALIKKISEQNKLKYQEQIKLTQERSQNLLSIFNTSKSKQEDLKKIEMIESKLMKKEIELDKQRQDLRICRLELTNMDQLFQKMFQDAKMKSSKTKKVRLPSLMSKNGINRSTMDCYQQAMRGAEKIKQKKFSIRDYSYQSMAKQIKDVKNQVLDIHD